MLRGPHLRILAGAFFGAMPKHHLTVQQRDRLKCASFYFGLCIFMILIVIWNVNAGEGNVFAKMFAVED